MITIKRATLEKQDRDKKRHRYLLIIGERIFHISKSEVYSLHRQLNEIKTLWKKEAK